MADEEVVRDVSDGEVPGSQPFRDVAWDEPAATLTHEGLMSLYRQIRDAEYTPRLHPPIVFQRHDEFFDPHRWQILAFVYYRHPSNSWTFRLTDVFS